MNNEVSHVLLLSHTTYAELSDCLRSKILTNEYERLVDDSTRTNISVQPTCVPAEIIGFF